MNAEPALVARMAQAHPKLALAAKTLQVGGHALAEKVTKPVARSIEDVPIFGATLTSEWLTAVLCRNAPGARVVSFSNPGGSSGSTERIALRVEYNETGRPACRASSSPRPPPTSASGCSPAARMCFTARSGSSCRCGRRRRSRLPTDIGRRPTTVPGDRSR